MLSSRRKQYKGELGEMCSGIVKMGLCHKFQETLPFLQGGCGTPRLVCQEEKTPPERLENA